MNEDNEVLRLSGIQLERNRIQSKREEIRGGEVLLC